MTTTRNLEHGADRPALLVADPELAADESFIGGLARRNVDVIVAGNPCDALAIARTRQLAYAITELKFGEVSLLDLPKWISEMHPGCRVLVHSRYCSIQIAVELVRAGIADVMPKPTDAHLLAALILNENLLDENAPPLPAPNNLREDYIRGVFTSCELNVSKAARQLTMHRRTLQRLLNRTSDFAGGRGRSRRHPS